MALTVTAERVIPAAPGAVWSALTDPARISDWFADTSQFAPGLPFRLDFGDGDFFAGQSREWADGRELRLHWRFLDLGPRFEITYRLAPAQGGGTLVTVTDRGAPIASEAAALAEGWADFLERLDRHILTGDRTRFSWSPVIAFLAAPPAGTLSVFDDVGWLKTRFPTAACRLAHSAGALLIEFRDPLWGSTATHARIQPHLADGTTFAAVSHDGWAALSPGLQVAERRRYAATWQAAFARLEGGTG